MTATATDELVCEIADRWGLDPRGWSVLADGPNLTVRLPAAQAVVHVFRSEVVRERVTALAQARAALAEASIPTVPLVPSRQRSTVELVDGHTVQVEQWVSHDGRMNTWPRLQRGATLLARVHDAWSNLHLGHVGEACGWANWIAPADVVPGCERSAPRMRGWGLHRLVDDVLCLADLTRDDPGLPMQLVHGDFWDDNVYVRGEELVAVTDFDFVGRRPRIDDLALLLYFADEQPQFEGVGPRDAATRRTELTALVRAYDVTLSTPLDDDELAALPFALARQPMWVYGTWLPLVDDESTGRGRDLATSAAPAVGRALEVLAEAERWTEAFAGRAH